MINTNIKIFLVTFFTFFSYVTSVNSAFTSLPAVSDISTCSYKIEGYKVNGTTLNKGWKELESPECNKSIDFSTDGIPDGIFNLHFKSEDKAILPGPNVMGEYIKGEYKVDTTPVKCILNTITMYGIDNQYYDNGKLYYKANGAKGGKIELDITCTDTEYIGVKCDGVSCVSGIESYAFPTILGETPTVLGPNPTAFFKLNTKEKSIIKLIYNWNGNNNDIFDILDHTSFVYDYAGNESKLQNNSNTTLIIKSINGTYEAGVITPINSLMLTPDSIAPVLGVGGAMFDLGNDGSDNYLSIGSSGEYLAALNNRKIKLPTITDLGAGLRGYSVKIENYDDKFSNTSSFFNGSNLANGRITDIENKIITHNFSDVSKNGDYQNNGHRNYYWEVKTIKQTGIEKVDFICDMVDNCTSLPTPDFRIVSNIPTINNTTSDIVSLYEGKRSNFKDEYNLKINFKDKYDNEVVPVAGVKNITFNNNITNTLGTNQISTPDSGDGVEFKFYDGNSSEITFSNLNYTSYFTTINNKTDLDDGELNIKIKSAVPTYREYATSLSNPGAKDESMYGNSSSAELIYTKLTIDLNTLNGYNGVGEFDSSLDLDRNSFLRIYPDIRFDPILSFNSIGNIYPLVEGQFKKMNILNDVLDETELDEFTLDINIGTNNDFIEVVESKLSNGNISSGNWSNALKINNYSIIEKSPSFRLSNGKMDYNGSDIFEILPQTIGGINNDNSKIALYSVLNYLTNGKSVILPGIQTGFRNYGNHYDIDFGIDGNYETNSSVVFSEIEISGITQTNNDGLTNQTGSTTTNDSTTTFDDFSKITLFDLKTNINRKLSLALKGSDISKGTVNNGGSDIIVSNFSNFNSSQGLILKGGNILYIKDKDVEINCGVKCGISGKKTIIVENGNLAINSDMYYTDNNSILGIVLVGNSSNGINSQVKINENITNGVGVIYSEGPIVSVNDSGITYNGYNIGDNLYNQLHWRGSFISKNTVGGSIKDIDSSISCPYGTPEYKNINGTCTQEIAQSYDLIYLRRFARVNEQIYYGTDINPMSDGKVPLNYDLKNVKIAGGIIVNPTLGMNGGIPNLETTGIDSYNAPLIIDYDSQIQINPPYLFE